MRCDASAEKAMVVAKDCVPLFHNYPLAPPLEMAMIQVVRCVIM